MRDHLSAVQKSFAAVTPRSKAALGDLAEYHLEKFSIYYGRRVPKPFQKEYAREFVAILSSLDLTFDGLGRKTSWLTKLCIQFAVFERNRPLVLQRLIETKDRVVPHARRLLTKARKAKQWMRHPLLQLISSAGRQFPGVKRGTILFLGFDHRYAGNSRALFEAALTDSRFAGRQLRFVTDDRRVAAAHRIRPGSLRFARAVQRAEYVIAESWIPLNVEKQSGSTWVQLWHGTPAKRMLFDTHELQITKSRPKHKINLYKDIQRWDRFLVDGYIAAQRFSTAFLLPAKAMLWAEYPRVSRLKERLRMPNEREQVFERLGLRDSGVENVVALYAPTWRDHNYGIPHKSRDYSYQINACEVLEVLGPEGIVLWKEHTYLSGQGGETGAPNLLDVSEHEIEDMLLISDLVITDYSSVAFDAQSLSIPVVYARKDVRAFSELRGVYGETLGGDYSQTMWPTEQELQRVLGRGSATLLDFLYDGLETAG